MAFEVEYTDEFGEWWETLTGAIKEDIDAVVGELERRGPNLPYPFSSKVRGSSHSHMRELRIQSGGHPIRIFYAFDPRRMAILLLGGDKKGDDAFYERMIPLVDRLYRVHLQEIGGS
ncbi:addiction module toxin RelE [Desulfobulbus sp. Tol-SR]|nr:addiction module toxin RelE [Desulfobulbus sp. Tol-SR]